MTWSEWIRSANTPEAANAIYHMPHALNRDDPRLAGPMEAIRKATAARTQGAIDADPVSPGANAEAKALLARLRNASTKGVLSGQMNGPASQGAETAAVLQLTGKKPAIYGATLMGGAADPSKPAPTTVQGNLAQELIGAHSSGSIIALTWLAPRPTDNAQANPADKLTDHEWSELLTPGSALNQLWNAQVDEAAKTLKQLEKAGIAVLWNPLPDSNGQNFWWTGRKGIHGSAELYRQLFERLVNHDELHNLVWVWQAVPPDSATGGGGLLSDYVPGLLYADALQIRLNQAETRFPGSRLLEQAAGGKVVGVELTGDLPSPDALAGSGSWAWFLAGDQPSSVTRDAALHKLYDDPRIVSLVPKQ